MPMQEGFATAALGSYARPPENPPERVDAELRRLIQCTPETEQAAYNGVLYAVGNNHRGTYYPVVVPVIGLLGQVLREGSTAARETTLNVLVDLVSSFAPEPGFETIEGAEGTRRVEDLLWDEVLRVIPLVQELAKAKSASARERQLARELQEFLEIA